MAKKRKQAPQKGVVVVTVSVTVRDAIKAEGNPFNGAATSNLYKMRTGFLCADINNEAALRKIGDEFKELTKDHVARNPEYFDITPTSKVGYHVGFKKLECDLLVTPNEKGGVDD